MAKSRQAQADTSERAGKFKELAIEKIIRRSDPLISELLARITDAQWASMAKLCRFNANKAINVLLAEGVKAMVAAAK